MNGNSQNRSNIIEDREYSLPSINKSIHKILKKLNDYDNQVVSNFKTNNFLDGSNLQTQNRFCIL